MADRQDIADLGAALLPYGYDADKLDEGGLRGQPQLRERLGLLERS